MEAYYKSAFDLYSWEISMLKNEHIIRDSIHKRNDKIIRAVIWGVIITVLIFCLYMIKTLNPEAWL
jgi:hypothetical protein